MEKEQIPNTANLDQPAFQAEESLIVSLEQIKSSLRQKYPIDDIYKQLETADSISTEDKNIIEQRYENCLECAAKVEQLYSEYEDDVKDRILYGGRDFPLNIPGRIGTDYTIADISSPFVGWGRVIGDRGVSAFEKSVQFNPDIVIPTPSSAVLPAMMVKKFFEVYSVSHPDTTNPFFVIPRQKSKGIVRDDKLVELQRDIKEEFKPLDRESFEHRWMAKWAPVQEGESMDEIYNNYLKNDTWKNISTAISRFRTKDEVKILILDEFKAEGRTIAGTSQLVSIIFDTMKEVGELPKDTELKIEELNLNNEKLYGSGAGWLNNYDGNGSMYTKFKGGALPIHQVRRKFFEIVGEHFVKEFEILQELKKKGHSRASIKNVSQQERSSSAQVASKISYCELEPL